MKPTLLKLAVCGIFLATGCNQRMQDAEKVGTETGSNATTSAKTTTVTSNPELTAVMNGIRNPKIRGLLLNAWNTWEKYPSDSDSANTVIRIVEQAGEEHFTNGDRAMANPAFKLAGELHQKAITAGIEIDDTIEAYIYYNNACLKSVDKKLPEALDLLSKAIETGFSDLPTILEDPDLAPLRTMPEFQTRLNEWKTQLGEDPLE